MNDNWQDCPTMKSVVEAMERGDEIEAVRGTSGNFEPWNGCSWFAQTSYRCRPAKKTKTVVMRECLVKGMRGYYLLWIDSSESELSTIVRYTGNERIEEVTE